MRARYVALTLTFFVNALALAAPTARWTEIKDALEAKDHAKAEALVRAAPAAELKEINIYALTLLDYACHGGEESVPCKLLFLKGVRVAKNEAVTEALAKLDKTQFNLTALQEIARVKRAALTGRTLAQTVSEPGEAMLRYLLSLGVKPDCFEYFSHVDSWGNKVFKKYCPIDAAVELKKDGIAKEFYQMNQVFPSPEVFQKVYVESKISKDLFDYLLAQKPEAALPLVTEAFNAKKFADADHFLAINRKTWSDFCGDCSGYFLVALRSTQGEAMVDHLLAKGVKVGYGSAYEASKSWREAWAARIVQNFIAQDDFQPTASQFNDLLGTYEASTPLGAYVLRRYMGQFTDGASYRRALYELTRRPEYVIAALHLPFNAGFACGDGKSKYSNEVRRECYVIDLLYIFQQEEEWLKPHRASLIAALVAGKHDLGVTGGDPSFGRSRSFFAHFAEMLSHFNLPDDLLLTITKTYGIDKGMQDNESIKVIANLMNGAQIKTAAAIMDHFAQTRQAADADRLFYRMTYGADTARLDEILSVIDVKHDAYPTLLGAAIEAKNYERVDMLLKHGYDPTQYALERKKERVTFYDYLWLEPDLDDAKLGEILFAHELPTPSGLDRAFSKPYPFAPKQSSFTRFLITKGAVVGPSSLEKIFSAYAAQISAMASALIAADREHNSIDECALENERTVYNVVEAAIETHPDVAELRDLLTEIEKKTLRNRACEIPR